MVNGQLTLIPRHAWVKMWLFILLSSEYMFFETVCNPLYPFYVLSN